MAVLCGNLDVVRILVDSNESKGRSSDSERTDMINSQDNDSKTPLIMAAELGHVEIAQYFVQSGADLALKDGTGKTAVHYAVLYSLQILNILIAYNKSVINMKDGDSRTPLHFSAKYGDIGAATAIVEAARETGYQNFLTVYDKHRMTPLHHAAQSGHAEIAAMIKAEDDRTAEYPDKYGSLPEDVAAKHGHLDVIRAITRGDLERGSDLLVAASRSGQILVVKYLLQSNINPNGGNDAPQRPMIAAAANGRSNVIHFLLKHHADVCLSSPKRLAPLHWAAYSGHKDVAWILLTHEDDRGRKENWEYMKLAVTSNALGVLKFLVGKAPEAVTMISDNNTTLLWVAAGQSESPEVLTLLLEAGSDVNHPGPEGDTPLIEAVCVGNAAHVQQLIDWKADVKCRDEDGDTALSLAASQHNLNVVKILIEAKAPINDMNHSQETPIYRASQFGDAKIAQCLLEAGADPSICAQDTCCPLHKAAANFEITKLLVDYGADVNYQTSDGWSLLYFLACWGGSKVVRLLLERGADPNLVNDAGMTALYVAIGDDKMEVFDVILAHQGSIPADINKPDNEGFTAIHTAITAGSSVAVRRLIDHGAKVGATLEDGTTCLDLAIENDLPEALSALLDMDRLSPSEISWGHQTLVTAYWRAVKKAQSKSIKALLRFNDVLSEEVSKEGSNGLEEYMYLSIFDMGDIRDSSLLAQFVKLGLDPFKRRQGHPLTCFELGFMSREDLDVKFLDICLGSISKDLKMGKSALGFKELRIATELEDPDFWTTLAPLMGVIAVECDQDHWNIHHFLYQAMPRKEYARHRKRVLRQTKTPTALVWPHMWQRIDQSVETRLEILAEGLEASFSARPAGEDPVTIRANFPFPPRGPGIVYFEVSILKMAQETASEVAKEKARVVIGLSGEFSNQADAVPGRNMWSIGYDGIDGNVYEEGDLCNETDMFVKPYSVNRTVGCGIDYQEGEYFFTYNGEVICKSHSFI
ncbi:hypothetical protein ACHAPE_008765 [Trichoderma viride]